jgi:DNA-binding MarR family transcriptional regulator
MGTIGSEIKQGRPFRSAADEAVVTLLGTADRVRTALGHVIEQHDLTLQQYNVLRILRGAGEKGLPTLEIASRMIEANPGITRLVDRLERKRLARRVRCPEDRRQVLCHATPLALALLETLEAPVAAVARTLLAPLDAARTAELVRLLDLVRAAAAPPEGGLPSPENPKDKTKNPVRR